MSRFTSYFFVPKVANVDEEGGVVKNETAYRASVLKKLPRLLPGCFIVKPDPAETQGIPDVLVLFKKGWAMLEFKKAASAAKRPNQGHYIKKFGEMSFAAFIHPGNEEEVLRDLQSALGAKG